MKRHRKKTAKSFSRANELRARWLCREWERDPTYTYPESIAALRDRFEIGIGMAETATARAREMLMESTSAIDLDWILAQYKAIVAGAFADHKWNAARAALDSIAYAKSLVAAPQRGTTVNMMGMQNNVRITPQMTEEEYQAELAEIFRERLAAMSPVERTKLLAESTVTNE